MFDIKCHVIHLLNQEKQLELKQINNTINSIFNLSLIACEALPQIYPQALLAQYKKHLSHLRGGAAEFLNKAISSHYLESLNASPQNTYKHICRNLTWQLVTTILRSIFSEVSTSKHSDLPMRLLEPLMATLHRAAFIHGFPPNFFRLAETAYLSTIKQYEKKLSPTEFAWVQEYRQQYQTGKKKDLTDCAYLDKALLGYMLLRTSWRT